MDDERLGFLTGLVAYVLWGLLTLYWHELTGLDAFGLIAWRIVWSVVILAGALTVLRRWPMLRVALGREHLLATSIAAIALATNWTTYVWCVTHGRVVDTALGYFLAPIAVVLAGVIASTSRCVGAQASRSRSAVSRWSCCRSAPARRRGSR